MDNQKKYFNRLALGPIPAQIIKFVADVKPGDVVYSKGAYKTRDPGNSEPRSQKGYCEHDTLLFIEQVGLVQNERRGKIYIREKIKERVIVSVEIKTTVRDLFESDVDKYLGVTDFFFIAAPRELVPAVIRRREIDPEKEHIGVIDSDSDSIVISPLIQETNRQRQDTLVRNAVFSIHECPCYNDVGPYVKRQLSWETVPVPAFQPIESGFLNVAYEDIYCCAKDHRFYY